MKSGSTIAEKGYAEQKKKLLLHEWIQITKSLYTHKKIQNPFTESFAHITNQLGVTEQLLFTNLVQCITLMNRNCRANDEGELLSSEEDNLNALQLVLPEELQLKSFHAEIIESLTERFGNDAFTYYQAAFLLKCSLSSIKRKLQPLLTFRKLEKTGRNKSRRLLLKLSQVQISSSAYEEAMIDWEDYQGFTDTVNRN